jgi:hypothetical protein
LVIVDPEAVEREMNGLAVGVRGDELAGKARLGIRLYRLEDLVGVPVSVDSCIISTMKESTGCNSRPHHQKAS